MPVISVPISQIDPPDPVLRRFSEISVDFLELVAQVKKDGGSLQIPPARARPGGRFQLIDGHRRYRAYVYAGLTEMKLNIVEKNDVQYLASQMACNSGHEETSWIDFANHLNRLRYLAGEEMTLAELAGHCEKSKTWVSKILRLNNLQTSYKVMLQRNEIPLGNALWLAKLPPDFQSEYIDDARTMKTGQFEKVAQQAYNDHREKIRQGKLNKLGVDKFRPIMRDLRVVEAEMKSPTHLPLLLASVGLKNPIEIAIFTLKWAFRLDPKTIEERQEKVLNRERQRLNDAERRSKDREKMRLREDQMVT